MTYTLVTTAKNEGPYFLEWVAYHRMIGFDRIMVFQNDSTDLTDPMLKLLQKIGAVQYSYNRAGVGRHQVRAYKRAARRPEFRDSDWVMALDLDEFLHIKTGAGHLDDLFAALPEADQVLVNWRWFGNDGRTRLEDGLVTEHFLSADHEDRITTHLTPFKAMFRPSHFERCGIHKPNGLLVPEDSVCTVNGSGLAEGAFEIHGFRAKDPGRRALAQINHYMVRDAESFVLKSDRGSAHQAHRGIDKRYWHKRNFNEQRDTSLAGRSDEIIAAIADLDAMAGGELSALRERSLAMHHERFETLLKDRGHRELYDFCVEHSPKPEAEPA